MPRELFFDRSSITWDGCYFKLTESGENELKKFYLGDEEDLESRVLLEIREELRRIFDEYGVGLDIDLSHDKLFAIESD